MNQALGRWLFRLLLFAIMVGGTYLLIFYRQDIIDRLRLLTYTPPAEIVALADAAAMDGRGRDLFYVSNPQVQNKELFNVSCTDTGEESLVLGCYSMQQIYVYNVTDPRLKGVKEVTAAHEMLHAAYERLPESERQRINKLLVEQLGKIRDERLKGLIDLYNKEEPGHLLNEMHSILGTEFGGLSQSLEDYYSQYFSERAKVVALANSYAATFTESQKRIEEYDIQLTSLKARIDANNAELEVRIDALNSLNAQLDSLRASNPAAYNSAVPGYNADVRAYNNLAANTRALVSEYNELVEKRNNEAAAQNDLYHSLDSNYQEVGNNR